MIFEKYAKKSGLANFSLKMFQKLSSSLFTKKANTNQHEVNHPPMLCVLFLNKTLMVLMVFLFKILLTSYWMVVVDHVVTSLEREIRLLNS